MALFAIGDLHLPFGDENKPMHIFKGWENHIERLIKNWNSVVKDDDTVIIIGDISWALKAEDAVDDLRFINDSLNGEKIIVKGNHDLWWATTAKVEKLLFENNLGRIKFLFNNAKFCDGKIICGTRGWINIPDDFVFLKKSQKTENIVDNSKIVLREAGRLRLSLEDGLKIKSEYPNAELIAFLHYPPIYSNNENTLIVDVLNEYKIRRCFYAHLHGISINHRFKENDGTKYGIEFKLCSADYLGFLPFKIHDDENKIKEN